MFSMACSYLFVSLIIQLTGFTGFSCIKDHALGIIVELLQVSLAEKTGEGKKSERDL